MERFESFTIHAFSRRRPLINIRWTSIFRASEQHSLNRDGAMSLSAICRLRHAPWLPLVAPARRLKRQLKCSIGSLPPYKAHRGPAPQWSCEAVLDLTAVEVIPTVSLVYLSKRYLKMALKRFFTRCWKNLSSVPEIPLCHCQRPFMFNYFWEEPHWVQPLVLSPRRALLVARTNYKHTSHDR